MLRDEKWDQKLIVIRNNDVDELWNGSVKLGEITWTDVSGKKSLDVNVTSLTLSSSDDSVETRSQPMKTAIDEASSTVTYIGEATTGTTTSSSNWRIKRLTQSGSVLIIEWADGNGNFDNIWDNRTSLTYS